MIISILSKYPYRFYAYGSRVKEQARQHSDLDLCYREEIPLNVLSHLREDLEESDLPFSIDLVAWNWMSPEFQELIKNDLVMFSNVNNFRFNYGNKTKKNNN